MGEPGTEDVVARRWDFGDGVRPVFAGHPSARVFRRRRLTYLRELLELVPLQPALLDRSQQHRDCPRPGRERSDIGWKAPGTIRRQVV